MASTCAEASSFSSSQPDPQNSHSLLSPPSCRSDPDEQTDAFLQSPVVASLSQASVQQYHQSSSLLSFSGRFVDPQTSRSSSSSSSPSTPVGFSNVPLSSPFPSSTRQSGVSSEKRGTTRNRPHGGRPALSGQLSQRGANSSAQPAHPPPLRRVPMLTRRRRPFPT